MNLNNLTELELYFANHFDTVLFPVLAELYLKQGDLDRARKVCDIGLGHHPREVDGLFVLAGVELAAGDLVAAERLLRTVVDLEPPHFQATLALARIQEVLGRALATCASSWKKVLELDPENGAAADFFKTAPSVAPAPEEGPLVGPPAGGPGVGFARGRTRERTRPGAGPEMELDTPAISSRMVTFTMVAVLRNQGLHYQALDVLDLLEQKGANPQRVCKEREAIQADMQVFNDPQSAP